MKIGAIGAYSFRPYVYNANTVSGVSLNKVSRISDDVLDKKIDYSELTEEEQNENPLKKGQTLDFQGLLERQMQKGWLNAARVLRPAEETQAAEETAQTADVVSADAELAVETAESTSTVNGGFAAADNTDSGYSSYQMQQAINAYEMMMTA